MSRFVSGRKLNDAGAVTPWVRAVPNLATMLGLVGVLGFIGLLGLGGCASIQETALPRPVSPAPTAPAPGSP